MLLPSPELEFTNVVSATQQKKLSLVGIVNFQGGASVDLHFSSLNEKGKLVYFLDGTSIKEHPQNQSPIVNIIALGQAYDVVAGALDPELATEAYHCVSTKSAILAMAESYRRVVARIHSSKSHNIEIPITIKQISFEDIPSNLQNTVKTVAIIY